VAPLPFLYDFEAGINALDWSLFIAWIEFCGDARFGFPFWFAVPVMPDATSDSEGNGHKDRFLDHKSSLIGQPGVSDN
jgi:hypothetical protein